MNRYLEVLAREQPAVKFIRMLSAEADQEDGYDHVALPTLMIYKAKDVSVNAAAFDSVYKGISIATEC
jgi:Phosducin